MYFLGIDLETTGLDATRDRIIEIGAVLWDTDSNAPVSIVSAIINPELSQPGFDAHPGKPAPGLNRDNIRVLGASLQSVWHAQFARLVAGADALMAHNAGFERSFLPKEWVDRPWIDTQIDLPPDAYGEGASLAALCYKHRVTNQFPHRAAFDVLAMMQVAAYYPADWLLAQAMSPLVTVVALIDYAHRDLAKTAGFRWDGDAKTWEKTARQQAIQAESVLWQFNWKYKLEKNG